MYIFSSPGTAPNQAVNHGIASAKAVNAKVTSITVSTPFHIFAAEAGIVADTLESYSTRMGEVAAKRLAQVKDAAAAANKLRHRARPVRPARTSVSSNY
jgi:hypothetical protein